MRYLHWRVSAGIAGLIILCGVAFADDSKTTPKRDDTKPPLVKGGTIGTVHSVPIDRGKDARKQDRLGKVTGGAALGREGAAGKDALGGLPNGGRRPETGGFGQLGQGSAEDRLGSGRAKPDPGAFGRQRGQSDGLDGTLPGQGRTGGDADRFRGRVGAPKPRDVGGLAGDGENGDGPDSSAWTHNEDGKVWSRSVTVSEDRAQASVSVRYDAPNGEHEEVTEVRRDNDGDGTFEALVSRHVVDRDANGNTETQTVTRTDAGDYRLSVTRTGGTTAGGYRETVRSEPSMDGILENIRRNVDPDSPYSTNGKPGPDGDAWIGFRTSRPGTRGRPDDRATGTPRLRTDQRGAVANPGPYQERGGRQNRGARAQDGGKLVNPGGGRSGKP